MLPVHVVPEREHFAQVAGRSAQDPRDTAIDQRNTPPTRWAYLGQRGDERALIDGQEGFDWLG
jgi:hypothetical protein